MLESDILRRLKDTHMRQQQAIEEIDKLFKQNHTNEELAEALHHLEKGGRDSQPSIIPEENLSIVENKEVEKEKEEDK